MADPRPDTIPGRFEVKATASDHFAWLRTRLSVERTLMSWVRTATALIGFGFAIVPARFPDAPRYLGLILILCGVIGLVVSVLQYRWTLRYLWGGSFAVIAGETKEGQQTPLFAIAILLILVGLFAFFTVLLRLA